jgi:hypothetical protein
VRIDSETATLTVISGAFGIIAALTFSAPTALADPAPPDPAPAPFVVPAIPAPAPPIAPADPAIPAPAPMAAPAPGPGSDSTIQTAAGDPATPADGVPHLSSPENLPPGTTDVPPDAGQPRTLGYLRDLWHAVQTQEVSGRDALLLLTQRPMNPDSGPPRGMPANPTPPLVPEPAPAPPAEPALPLLPPPAPAS